MKRKFGKYQNISSHVLKISANSLMLCPREITYFFNTFDELPVYLVFTLKKGTGSIPGLATYFRFSFRCFKKGSCQILAKICARSTG